jgi:predicted TIM-barrel fold metal-dependent hydrolase
MLTIGGERVLAIDADAHVIESEQTWSYLDPSEESFRPILVGSEKRPDQQYWLLHDKVVGFRFVTKTARELEDLSQKTGRDMNTSPEARELGRVDLRIEHMEQLGIDIQVLHNTLWIEQVTNRPEAELALCRSYNRWLADTWAHGKGRLLWSCMPPTLSIAEAIKEVGWCKEHGAVGICLRPLEGDHHLTDSYFFPLYEEAQRLDMPITVHIANGNPGNVDLVRHSLFWRFRVPTVAACYAYLQSHVPETFPKLRVGFIEAGAQWLVWVLEGATRNIGLPKSALPEVLARKRVWVTCEYEDHLPYLAHYAGEDNLIIGTDYGHTDPFSNVQALNVFANRQDLDDRIKKKIIRDNAVAFYGLREADLKAFAGQPSAANRSGEELAPGVLL